MKSGAKIRSFSQLLRNCSFDAFDWLRHCSNEFVFGVSPSLSCLFFSWEICTVNRWKTNACPPAFSHIHSRQHIFTRKVHGTCTNSRTADSFLLQSSHFETISDQWKAFATQLKWNGRCPSSIHFIHPEKLWCALFGGATPSCLTGTSLFDLHQFRCGKARFASKCLTPLNDWSLRSATLTTIIMRKTHGHSPFYTDGNPVHDEIFRGKGALSKWTNYSFQIKINCPSLKDCQKCARALFQLSIRE